MSRVYFCKNVDELKLMIESINYPEIFLGKLIGESVWFYFSILEIIEHNQKLFLKIVKHINAECEINQTYYPRKEIQAIELHLFEEIYLATEVEESYLLFSNAQNDNTPTLNEISELDHNIYSTTEEVLSYSRNALVKKDVLYSNDTSNYINYKCDNLQSTNNYSINNFNNSSNNEYGGWMKLSSKKFGLKYLEKYGFNKGEGLGKNKDGISEPICYSNKTNNTLFQSMHISLSSKAQNNFKHFIPFHHRDEFNKKLGDALKLNQKIEKNNIDFSKYEKEKERKKDKERLNNILNNTNFKRDYFAKMKRQNLTSIKKEFERITNFLNKSQKELSRKNFIKYNIKKEVLTNLISLKLKDELYFI